MKGLVHLQLLHVQPNLVSKATALDYGKDIGGKVKKSSHIHSVTVSTWVSLSLLFLHKIIIALPTLFSLMKIEGDFFGKSPL